MMTTTEQLSVGQVSAVLLFLVLIVSLEVYLRLKG
jgi:hypothetical protein